MRANQPSSWWCRLPSSSLITTNGITTSCSANREFTTSWARYSSAARPTAPALTRNGMSLLTNVTSLPSAARLSAHAKIRESLESVRKPTGSTEGSV
ncbi:Uncharacterised protein [Mycobacteroides abscessus subsp. abscessus]|nr:Uncharacterised protein [Mycobacteroides abscessus subsp. abscessus]